MHKDSSFIEKSLAHWISYTTLIMCCVRPFGQKSFSIVQKYEYNVKVKGRPHGRTRGSFTSYFCTCTTFLASYTYKSTCVCTSTTSSNHVGFLYVVHVYDVQMYELAFFKWAYYHRWSFKSNGVLQDMHYKLFYILIFSALTCKEGKIMNVEDCR